MRPFFSFVWMVPHSPVQKVHMSSAIRRWVFYEVLFLPLRSQWMASNKLTRVKIACEHRMRWIFGWTSCGELSSGLFIVLNSELSSSLTGFVASCSWTRYFTFKWCLCDRSKQKITVMETSKNSTQSWRGSLYTPFASLRWTSSQFSGYYLVWSTDFSF